MNLYLIGIDYSETQLQTREAVYRERKNISELFERICGQKTVIFSTCNRFEIYLTIPDNTKIYEVVNLLQKEFPQFFNNSYIKFGEKEVFFHILRLACGLESQLKGETQIKEQLKHRVFQENFPEVFRSLWLKALIFAEDIRKRSGLNNARDNIAVLIAEDLLRLHLDLPKIEVIIVGAGKIAELFTSVNDSRFSFTFVAHKNRQKAEILAKNTSGRCISFEELPEALIGVQALVSATSSPHFVVKKDDFFRGVSDWSKPFYIYDLALPPDIDPAIGGIKNIFLKNFENLELVFDEHNQKLKTKLNLAEYLIQEVEGEYQEGTYENDSKSWYAPEPVSFRAS